MKKQKLKRKLRSAFAKENILLTLEIVDIEYWKYKGSLKNWIDKCFYYKDRYGELHKPGVILI